MRGDVLLGFFQDVVSIITIGKEFKNLFSEGRMLLNNKDYFFKDFHRKTFVDSNGNAVIYFEQVVHIVNPDKCDFLTVDLDVSDGKDCCEFPEFKEMIKEDKKFFQDYKFCCIASDDITGNIREDYSHLNSAERINLIKSKKFISIKIPFKKSHLRANNDYKVAYAFSVPDMYPIINGRIGGIQDIDNFQYIESWISCAKRHKKLKYSLYLSNEIQVKDDVFSMVRLQDSNDATPNHIDNYNFLLYNKYVSKIEKAYKYRDICIKWSPIPN